MIDKDLWSVERVAGVLLVLGFFVFLPGGVMFMLRGGTRGGAPPTPVYFVWERTWVMAAVVVSTLGVVLLAAVLQSTGGRALAAAGATAYLIAGILLVAAEALRLRMDGETVYPLVVVYVVLAFLSQAAAGGALLQSGTLPAWIGWATIVWNLTCLVLLPLATPKDIYFPVMHHVMPLVIGIVWLWTAR
jgi:hypothetical protein